MSPVHTVTARVPPTYGEIALPEGYALEWCISGDRSPEVYGVTRKPGGGYVPRSGGWYRTTDPQAAARIAALNLWGDGLLATQPGR